MERPVSWKEPIDGRYGFFLLEGAVTVTNYAGAATLDQPGEGVNLDGPNGSAGPGDKLAGGKGVTGADVRDVH